MGRKWRRMEWNWKEEGTKERKKVEVEKGRRGTQ